MKIEDARILVIDDDGVMRNHVVTLLKRLGAGHFQVAGDGRSGLEMALSFRPDLVISDVHMEPIDGLDFVRSLRSHSIAALRGIPVLMMSADSSSQTLHESVPLGIVGYLVKPPQLSCLKSKIEQGLNAPD
jgi:CheY-like chemotaxis protein